MASPLLNDHLLFFCENAATGTDGKLNAESIYNELYAPGFPARQDRIVLAGILEWQREVEGDQHFMLEIVDPEAKPIFSIEGQTRIDARSPGRPPAKTHLVFPLPNLVFPKSGEYRVRLTLGSAVILGPALHLLVSGKGEYS